MPNMSNNIGKQSIKLLKDIQICKIEYLKYNKLIFKTSKDIKELNYPKELNLTFKQNEISIKLLEDNKQLKAAWGLFRNLIQSIIIGLTEGYTKRILLKGVGYRFQTTPEENKIQIFVGYTKPIEIQIPKTIKIQLINNTTLEGKAKDLQELTNIFNKIRILKPASKDHYKGKGIFIE